MNRRSLLHNGFAYAMLLPAAFAGGCRSVEHLSVPRQALGSETSLDTLRVWADDFGDTPTGFARAFAERARTHFENNGRTFTILALSGGGQSGAYGAGLLNGWTAAGTRPQFDLVTGISTGAIIAPFAFLGSRYDPVLKEIYTTTRTRDIGRLRVVAGLTTSDGFFDVKGFEALLKKHVTPALLEEIADEYNKGRMLLVGTTNLEAQRGVIWNMGGLAASDRPDKLDMFARIIRASASIPGAFPPAQIPVVINGEQFDELHVDGGVTEQVFIYPPNVTIKALEDALGFSLEKRIFVVRNTKLSPTYSELKAKTLEIVSTSLNTLIRNQGLADVRTIHDIAKRDGMAFAFTAIPPSFDRKADEFFDPDFMRPLFELGYKRAVENTAWRSERP